MKHKDEVLSQGLGKHYLNRKLTRSAGGKRLKHTFPEYGKHLVNKCMQTLSYRQENVLELQLHPTTHLKKWKWECRATAGGSMPVIGKETT